jgi:NAD(P)-dependent dehydrogenase (short-subunit alcohol dehydrogenase family)
VWNNPRLGTNHPRGQLPTIKELIMKKEVMIVTGAGQIGMALARRIGFGKKIILGDKNLKNAETIAEIMNNAGYDVVPFPMDLSSRKDILAIIAKAQEYGEIKYLINAAGVSPSQAPIEAILKVDLYGTAVLLEEVGKVIAEGGAGVTISSQSGWRMPQLTPEEDRQLAMTPTEELLNLPLLQPETSRILCMLTSLLSAAMKSALCMSAFAGASAEQDSMTLPRASS